MPDKSRTGHPIKALFTVVWDTGLRISALRRLECPRHFAPGDDCLRISREIDKNRWERPLALTVRSRRCLEELVAEDGGLIFGEYNYLKTLRATARKVRNQTKMSERECSSLDARDFRHAAGTHMAEVSDNVAGIAFNMGHTDLRTTSQYVHPPKRSGDKVTHARFAVDWDYFRDYPCSGQLAENANLAESMADAKGFEPPTSASGDQSAIAFSPRFPGFRDSSECAVARESVRFCAPTGLVIPPHIVQLAWAVLEDGSATEREVKLARWVLLSTLKEGGDG